MFNDIYIECTNTEEISTYGALLAPRAPVAYDWWRHLIKICIPLLSAIYRTPPITISDTFIEWFYFNSSWRWESFCFCETMEK